MKISKTLVLVLLFSFLFMEKALPSVNARSLIAFDVGEGQSIGLKSSEKGLLIDTGSLVSAPLLLGKLQSFGITQIEKIILTHLHPDHASGVFRVFEKFPLVEIHDNCDNVVKPKHRALSIDPVIRWTYDLVTKKRKGCLKAGKTLNWQNFQIKILWPEKVKGLDLNANSLVLLISDNEAGADAKKVLIMGDVNSKVELSLIKKIPSDIDVLIAGHHGAKDTGAPSFLSHINPKLSIISVNSKNIRGYPDKKTLSRIRKASKRTLVTGLSSDVCVDLSSKKKELRVPCR